MIPDLPTSPTRAGVLQRHFREIATEESEWMLVGNRDPKADMLPWMPFQPADFLSIMYECVLEANGSAFLDVGCGIGTKMLLAREMFGLDAWGVEIDHVMAEQARTRAVGYDRVLCANALTTPLRYNWHDIIWLYRPYRNPQLETQLEERLVAEMKSGSILAGGAWEMASPPSGWMPIVDDWEIRRGAWMKP